MMNRLNLMLVAGARPNFMKIAPLVRAIEQHNTNRRNGDPQIDYKLVHTGQHYDPRMSTIFFQELGMPAPHINLGVGSGSHAVQTATVMTRFEPMLESARPDWLVVVGDVNSTLACTLVAAKLGVRVAHVEAGLRSFDRSMPEEINRLATDALADLLLTPSEDADRNLAAEGVDGARIRRVGNIMIDSLNAQLQSIDTLELIARRDLVPGEYIYVTLHRPANVDQPDTLQLVMGRLTELARKWTIIFPVHPRTRSRLADCEPVQSVPSGLRVVEPVGYRESLAFVRHARCVLTDSGGLQEESTFFRTPCLTLRPNTERPVTLTCGSNRLTTPEDLEHDLADVLARPARFGEIPPLWDGHTAGRTLQAILEASGFGSKHVTEDRLLQHSSRPEEAQLLSPSAV
ncbi:MAG: UDP-N-acetylglucosamine 2-epimerase (non-hydrolyzing) [Verrucomicrobiales bacterium]|nr:UDP-N-acetylglucosamine 2-epimerase (non-hydrolyzing) [Verrucomicrobiales bacterium]